MTKLFKPCKSHECWQVRFVYQGKQYSRGFGKGDQAEINASIVADAIIDDLKNDRFLGSITPYLDLIPVEQRTWRKSPSPDPNLKVKNPAKRKGPMQSCKPYRASANNCWVVRFVYKGKQHSQSFGKGDQAEINAGIVSAAIIDDIKNDRFQNSITPYLDLIPVEQRTWRKKPKPPRPKPELLKVEPKVEPRKSSSKQSKTPNPTPELLELSGDKCLGCGSPLRVRNGKVNGKQRWMCCNCGRQRLENAKYRFPTGKQCYVCGKTTRKRGKVRGVQRYWCPSCRAYWSDRNLPEVPTKISWYNGGLLG